jgi:uncharacterized membrane protein YccC
MTRNRSVPPIPQSAEEDVRWPLRTMERDCRCGVPPCLVQRNFELQKVALGTCGRDFGTHVRTKFLCQMPAPRVDPAQIPRLEDIHANLGDRLQEAENKTGSARSPRSRPPWPPPLRSWRPCVASPDAPAFISACLTSVRRRTTQSRLVTFPSPARRQENRLSALNRRCE